MQFNHLMLDLETVGTRPNAPVLSIGAVAFNPETGELGSQFYSPISPKSAFVHGKPDGGTFRWWMEQGEAARKAAVGGTLDAEDVAAKFRQYLSQFGFKLKVWGNGSSFDITIMEYWFLKVQSNEAPWKFWNVRDCRTILELAEAKGFVLNKDRGAGVHHNALDDAIFQAKWVSDCWKLLVSSEVLVPKSAPAQADELF